MSWKASSIAKELTHGKNNQKLSMADKLVLMILSENYLEDKGYVWCSQKLLSKHCVCSERGLRGILERLQRFGLIGIAHRAKLGNYYNLLFMRNPIPHKSQISEEPHAVCEEAGAVCEEPHALSEEQAVPPERLTVKTVDGEEQKPLAHITGKAQPKPERRTKSKTWQRPSYKKESYVESQPTRSKGEQREDRTREALKIFDHPEKLLECLRQPLSPRRSK